MGMSSDATLIRAPDAVIGSREVYVVEATPAPDSNSAYERIVTFVDKETCVALVTSSYEPGGKLRKRLEADPDEITREKEIWVSRKQTIEDMRDQTRTELLIEQIDVDAEIHRKIFSERELEAGAR